MRRIRESTRCSLISSAQNRRTENPSFRSSRRWRPSLRLFRTNLAFQYGDKRRSSASSRRCQNGESIKINTLRSIFASASVRPTRACGSNGISAALKIENSESSGFVFLPLISRIRADTSAGSLVNGFAFAILTNSHVRSSSSSGSGGPAGVTRPPRLLGQAKWQF